MAVRTSMTPMENTSSTMLKPALPGVRERVAGIVKVAPRARFGPGHLKVAMYCPKGQFYRSLGVRDNGSRVLQDIVLSWAL